MAYKAKKNSKSIVSNTNKGIKLPVSVCIIAKDEERYIEECLKKLKPYGFEIVVTDTGSTDRTKEIALKYADKVLDFEWINDFAAARNYCAEHASNDWILALDCDEYVESLESEILMIFMKHYPSHLGIIRMKNLQLRSNGELGYGINDLTRMYNKKYFEFIQPIHEQIASKGEITGRDAFMIPMEVIHHGYAITGMDMVKKQERNIEILKSAIEKEPDNAYYYFQMGCALEVLCKFSEAAAMYEHSLSLIPNADRSYSELLITSLANTYADMERNVDALTLMERYEKHFSSNAGFIYCYANILLKNDKPLIALMNYLKATMMADSDALGENLLRCYERIIAIYQQTGNEDMAKPFEQKYLECRAERERIVNS